MDASTPVNSMAQPIAAGETAAHHAVASVPRAMAHHTAAQALAAWRERPPECTDVVCVLDDSERLLGTLPLGRLLSLPGEARLGDVAERQAPRVRADTDQERVASLALHHALAAVPVVDADDRLLGVVPTSALLRILRREHVEDLHRLAGITREAQRDRKSVV